jgi:hypothetical protein
MNNPKGLFLYEKSVNENVRLSSYSNLKRNPEYLPLLFVPIRTDYICFFTSRNKYNPCEYETTKGTLLLWRNRMKAGDTLCHRPSIPPATHLRSCFFRQPQGGNRLWADPRIPFRTSERSLMESIGSTGDLFYFEVLTPVLPIRICVLTPLRKRINPLPSG